MRQPPASQMRKQGGSLPSQQIHLKPEPLFLAAKDMKNLQRKRKKTCSLMQKISLISKTAKKMKPGQRMPKMYDAPKTRAVHGFYFSNPEITTDWEICGGMEILFPKCYSPSIQGKKI